MKKSVQIICLAGIAICAILLLLKHHNEKAHFLQENVLSNTQTTQQNLLSTDLNHETANVSKRATDSSRIRKPTATATVSNVINPQLLAEWQGSIEFYGKIVDENSNPVSGATVHFEWNEKPTPNGMITADTQSDAQGLFSLKGAAGLVLNVSVSKNGYYSSRKDSDSFIYGSLGGPKYTPDPWTPAIFHLKKRHTGQHLVNVTRNYRISRDGIPTSINLTTGKASVGGTGDFTVRCLTSDQGKSRGAKYNWDCILSISNGGLVLTDQEFPFLAPENGYISSTEISMPADIPSWRSEVTLQFYYHLANGCYGRMTFSMIAGGQHFCMIDSLLNPSGSRNLEPAQ